MRNLYRLILTTLALFCPALALGQVAGNFQSIAISGAGRPLSNINVAVCSGLSTTAAAVSGNVATLTMSANPISTGFQLSGTITVYQFSGADAYFNGTFTITNLNATQIQFALTHANASAGSNGNVVQQGGSTGSPCLPLTTLYTDSTGSNAATNPFQTDGLGNVSFWAAPQTYEMQYYGGGLTTTMKAVVVSCVPGNSNCGITASGNIAFSGNDSFSGTNTHSGAEAFAKINSLVYLDGIVNTTLASCYAAIAAGGGACVVPPNYTETMAASLTMNKANSGFIFMGPATIGMGSNQIIVTAGTQGVFFKGTVPFGGGAIGLGAQFTYSGNSKAFQIGSNAATTRMFAWDNVTIVFSGAGNSASGLYMTNVVYFRLINPSVVGDGATTGTVGIACDGTGNFCGTGEIIGPYLTGLGTGILGNGPISTGANAIIVLGGTVQSTVAGGIGIDLENADSSSVYGLDIESEAVAVKLGALAAGNFIRIRQEANTTDVQALGGSQFNVVQMERANVPVVSDAGTSNQFYRMQDGAFLNISTAFIQARDTGGIVFADSVAGNEFKIDVTGVRTFKTYKSTETTAPAGSAGIDTCYGDSTLHQPKCDFNGSGFFPTPQTGNTAGTHSDSGFYQTATAAGCTTAASIGGVCGSPFTVTWPTAFADTNYKMSCSPNGAATNLPSTPYVVTKSAGSVTMNYFAISAAAASWPNVECTAVHN